MQKMIMCALVAGAMVRSDAVLVTRVTSGDAITVASVGHIGLLGIAGAADRTRPRAARIAGHAPLGAA